ncbi:hypothetical protein [Stenotrophomonas maltophilia]|uniref:hypothetical protein n=1 Tax=Stenotrophomonas maltophilia TaxID=40324 RepID=UPI0038766299
MDWGHPVWVAAVAATGEVAKPEWWAPVLLQTGGTLLATTAGVAIGAWLVSRREASVRKEKREADALYLAVTVSGALEQFVSGCASVASDDGSEPGAPAHARLSVRVPMPKLELSGLDVEWKSLDGVLLDKVHSVPRRLANLADYLDTAAEHYDDDDFFADRQRKSAELGLYAARVSAEVRRSVGLTPSIDPDSTTVAWLGEKLEERVRIDRKRDEARAQMWNEIGSKGSPSQT